MRVDFNMISLECQEDKKEHSFASNQKVKALSLRKAKDSFQQAKTMRLDGKRNVICLNKRREVNPKSNAFAVEDW